MKVLFTWRARRDLDAIADFIAGDNPPRAISFVAEIERKCVMIGHAPESHPLSPEFGKAIRKSSHKNYLILYKLTEYAVIIAHVVHMARHRQKL